MNAQPPLSGRAHLRPLPLRVTEMQYEKLVAQRAYDGLPIQEHVRRALDFYFAMNTRQGNEAREEPKTELRQETPPAAASRRKLTVKRR